MSLQIKKKFLDPEVISYIDGQAQTAQNNAESYTDAQVGAEQTRAQSAEALLSSSISQETSRAMAAEESLSGDISAEQSRAQSAESSLAQSVASEVSRAQVAENSLSGLISDETSRAMAAEDTFLKTDGSRSLTGNMTVVNGSSIEFIDNTDPNSAQAYNYIGNGFSEMVDLNQESTLSMAAYCLGVQTGSGDQYQYTAVYAGRFLAQNFNISYDGPDATIAATQGQLKLSSSAGVIDAGNSNIKTVLDGVDPQDAVNKGQLDGEASTARAAEQSLSDAIVAEASTARAAELSLSNAIVAEASTARAAELSLSNAIVAEASTARAAESAEVSARQAAITATQNLMLPSIQSVTVSGSTYQISHTIDQHSPGVIRLAAGSNGTVVGISAGQVGQTLTIINESTSTVIFADNGSAGVGYYPVVTGTGGEVRLFGFSGTPRSYAAMTVVFDGDKWVRIGSIGGQRVGFQNYSSSVTLTAGFDSVLMQNSSPATVTLFAPIKGRVVTIKRSGTGQVTIAAPVSSSIDGQSSYVMSHSGSAASFVADGTNWYSVSYDEHILQNIDSVIASVTSEASTARAAELSLSNAISSESSRAVAAENSISGAVSSESSRAMAAELSLSNALDSESSRAMAAEQSLSNALDSESSRAMAAEQSLSDAIAAEQSRAMAAEQTFVLLDGTRTMTGALAMGGYKVTGMAPGVSANDAVTKSQLDSVVSGLVWLDPIAEPNLLSDNLTAAPVSPYQDVSYIAGVVTNPSDPWYGKNGHLLQWNGTSWVDILGRAVMVGDRFGILLDANESLTPSGGLTGHTGEIITVTGATPGSIAYMSGSPSNGQAVFVNADLSYSFGHNYLFSSAENKWVEFSGPSQIIAGNALSYAGKTLNVRVDGDTVQVNGSNQLVVGTSVLNNISGLQQDLSSETSRALAAEQSLNGSIQSEQSRAQSAESSLNSQILFEVSRAEAAEGSLASMISMEQSRASAAESSIASDLSSEIYRSESAESSLSGLISAEVSRAQGSESSLAMSISSEQSRAEYAENSLGGEIQSESMRAQSAESSLNSLISSEISRAQSAESSLNQSIMDEMSRAQGAESSLNSALSSEISRAQGAESSLSNALSGEISRAQGAESSLSSAIDFEKSRAMAAESSLSGAVDFEKSRAMAAESSLSSALDSEESRAMAAESSLSSGLSSEISRAQAAEGSLSTRVSALEADHFRFDQEKVVLSSSDISNGYIDLSHSYDSKALQLFVGRLGLFESDDYLVSVVGGVTRVTFVGSLVSGPETLIAGDTIHCKGAYRV
jgi:Coiled stalk of trimeric autotransporter adhesin